VGSIVLLQVSSTYEMKGFGGSHFALPDVIPIVPKWTDSKSCLVEYAGNFSSNVNVTKVLTTAWGIDFRLSWVRVFTDRNDESLYYQWMQGSANIGGGKNLEIDRVHETSGNYQVYYPIPENVTSTLNPGEFDYVKWIRENIS